MTRSSHFPGFPGGSGAENPPAMQETREMWVQSLDQEDPLEKEMVTPLSIPAWEISWTEELMGYSSWGHKRVRHDLVTTQQQS